LAEWVRVRFLSGGEGEWSDNARNEPKGQISHMVGVSWRQIKPFRTLILLGEIENGGRGGIRTHGSLATTSDFESGAFNHSATLPAV
jgi:hypothetical protein